MTELKPLAEALRKTALERATACGHEAGYLNELADKIENLKFTAPEGMVLVPEDSIVIDTKPLNFKSVAPFDTYLPSDDEWTEISILTDDGFKPVMFVTEEYERIILKLKQGEDG